MGNVRKRRLKDGWVSGFMDYTQGLISPPIYRKWAAFSAISASLGRKVHLRIVGKTQYSNLFIILTGPPGTGKGNALHEARDLCSRVMPIKLAPASITQRAFFTLMQEAQEATALDPITKTFDLHSSLAAFMGEFAIFIKESDEDFMTSLCDIYDNLPVFEHRTEHSGHVTVDNVFFTFVGGITTNKLQKRFTRDIFEGGFPSRCNIIYSREKIKVPLGINSSALELDEQIKIRDSHREDLVHDLEAINLLQGRYRFSHEAGEFLEDWVAQDMEPIPQDPRLEHYCSRRLAHVTKLCIIYAASERDELVIKVSDVRAAKATLIEAEEVMGGAIEGLGGNVWRDQGQSMLMFIKQRVSVTQKNAVRESLIRQHLNREVPPNMINQLIESVIAAGEVNAAGKPPKRVFSIPSEGGEER